MTLQTKESVLQAVRARLNDERAQAELQSIGDCKYDWRERVAETCELLVPILVDVTPDMVAQCERSINSADELGSLLSNDHARLISEKPEHTEWLEKCLSNIEMIGNLVRHLESQQISAEIQRIVSTDLADTVHSNGNSVYPDFVRNDLDYSFLPFQSRQEPIDGPCLKGKTLPVPKPSNVPDGLELKTNKGPKIKVDAHGAHPGLHLGVTWELVDDRLNILGVYVGYIRIFDHKLSGGRVAVTTRKASFGHNHFHPIFQRD